ncbi:hypothetical protein [Nonomuraea sp. NPDC003804]|uniref:hypothetical protein n=1 Tax=Nonomuraea sp. NPDC003804 TaxID=3154547 RepID=UPI0033A09EC7
MADDAFNLDVRVTTPAAGADPADPASITIVTRLACTRSWATCNVSCTCVCTGTCTIFCVADNE